VKTPRQKKPPPQLSLGTLLDDEGDPSESMARRHGATHGIGVDEVGRGPLAGPVVTAAVVIPLGGLLPDGVADSKALSTLQRQALLEPIVRSAVSHAISHADVTEIDGVNILQASLLAMRRAVMSAWRLAGQPHCVVLVDGREPIPELLLPQHCVIGGDARVKVIAAASILAKEHRDALLKELHEQHPQYGFDKHKGYATAEHLAALQTFGPSPHHRRSFEPVKSFVARGLWGGALTESLQEELW